MSLTMQESELLENRDNGELSDIEKELIDDTLDSIYKFGSRWNVPSAGDDRAAKFEASFIKYIIDSRK